MNDKTALGAQKTIEIDGVKLHYADEGQGPAVVLIHGVYGSLYDYKLSIFDELKKNYHTLAFDMPGHGSSTRPRSRMNLADHGRYLHKALKKLGWPCYPMAAPLPGTKSRQLRSNSHGRFAD